MVIWLITMKTILLTLVYFLCCDGRSTDIVHRHETTLVNDRPIIGILSQEISSYLHSKYPDKNYTSYIAASYVKHVESSGARVIPIMIGKSRQYYENIMRKINGVLLPGGATYFNQSHGYAEAGQYMYEIAQELNDKGDYFPMFGTCLGFELLFVLAAGRDNKEKRITCRSYSNEPLHFTNDYSSSKMFNKAPEEIILLLANYNITVNAHSFCIMDESLKTYNLTKDWRVTSHSKDENAVQFIATMEHNRYPFYGSQFHSEKPAFEWKLSKNYPHSMNAVTANRYFMDFFVNECRKNAHSFADGEENEYLIYNYEPHFTGVLGSAYQQCYLFEPRGTHILNDYEY